MERRERAESSLATLQYHHTEAEEIIIRNLISPQISSSVSAARAAAADRMLASCSISISGPTCQHLGWWILASGSHSQCLHKIFTTVGSGNII